MSFSLSSENIRFDEPNLLAECQTVDGDWKSSSLNLNDGIANINGVLEWRHGGNFMASSQDYNLHGVILTCKSQTVDGYWVDANINLDVGVTNENGVLKFHF